MFPSEPMPEVGGRYTLLTQLGAGGMGRVYLAHDARHDRRVAIKLLDPAYARGVGTLRFVQEIRIAAMLSHPSIVPLYDSGEADGRLFYVMPYIEGESLRQRLDRETMLPVASALEWAAEVAQGLAYAHAHGVIHRDIKPENLLLQSGRMLIADFGIGRIMDLASGHDLTSDQVAVGTPTYMSPEQAGGGKVDGRTDIYSLACVVYEMLVGEPPFRGPTQQSLMAKKLSGTYPAVRVIRPSVPRAVAEALDRALAPIPADRFGTAAEFAAALRRRSNRLPRLERRWAYGLAAAALGIAIGIGVGMPHRSAAPQRPTIIVEPFENRTGDQVNGSIGLMAADWVTEGLQRTGEVDVIPTVTAIAASRYVRESGDTIDPIKALARETGAGLVVTGAIYRSRDSLVVQAQLADPRLGRLVGAIEPLRIDGPGYADALQQLRARLMGLLALSLDQRVIQIDRPPTYIAYQAFSEGLSAYVRNEYGPALAAFQQSYASDTTFVLPLLYASFCLTNGRAYAAADSALRIVARDRERLNDYHRDWLDYQVAELAGDEMGALSAIRRAALRAPGSKATYNFAVTAFEAGQPFPAESALRSLSPDVGAMRGWLPYWDVLTASLHVQGKRGPELQAAREARSRFGDRADGYLPEARALAAQQQLGELDALWHLMRDRTHPAVTTAGNFALTVGDELQAHGDPAGAQSWYRRASQEYASADTAGAGESVRWGQALAADRLERWQEALTLGRALLAADSVSLDYRGLIGIAAAHLGRRDLAEAMLQQLAQEGRPFSLGHGQFQAARIAAALGQVDRAGTLLVSAYARGYPYDIDFHRDPALKAIPGRRTSPR